MLKHVSIDLGAVSTCTCTDKALLIQGLEYVRT